MATEKPADQPESEWPTREQAGEIASRSRGNVAGMTAEELLAEVHELQDRQRKLERSLEERTAELHVSAKEAALLANAVANLGEGVMITDDELDWPGPRIQFVNDAMCGITGYTADELVGQSPRVLQGPQTDRTALDRLKADLTAGRSCLVKLVNYHKDGTPYDAELFITQLFDSEGRRTNFVSIHRDVTQRRRAEEALRESEERFRLFMDNSPTIAWMKDERGQYVYLSGTFEQRFQASLEDWRGKTDFDIWPREIAEQFHKNDREVLDTSSVLEVVEQAPNSDGTFGYWRVFKFPFKDSEGARYVGGIGVDVTAQTRAEEALRASEERMRAILNTAADAIITVDQRGRIAEVNTATEAMFRYTAEELVGRNVSLLMPPPYCDEHDGYIARYLETGEAKIIGIGREVEGRRRDGVVFPVDLIVSEVEHLGLFTGIIRDVTQHKAEHERLLEAERLAGLGQAMAGLTHESRNALARSHANLRRLARRVKGDEELLALIDGALRANDDIRRQFEEVRDYAAPIDLKQESLLLPGIVKQAWEELAPERKGRRAKLKVNEPDLDLTCRADPFSLRNALRNVLENALAACPDPVAIDIGFSEAKIGELSAVQVSIRDNGPGMPPEVRERAFDAFFTTKTRGTGLGLAIVKRAVEAHGGQVAVGPNSGRGVEIVITLPRAPL